MAKNQKEKCAKYYKEFFQDDEVVFETSEKEVKKKKKKKKDGKKGKKKNKNKSIESTINLDKYFKHTLNSQWEEVIKDIKKMTKKLNKVDKMNGLHNPKGDKIKFYKPSTDSLKIRKGLIDAFKDGRFLNSIIYALTHAGSLISLIGKVFCILIVTLFSIDGIKRLVSPATMNMIDKAYTLAMSV